MALCKNNNGLLRDALEKGFSLIELLVVIAMLAVLFLALITTFNPVTQLNKAKDGQRQHDFEQIQRALDSYFNDMHCYPSALIFGTSWIVNGQVYMEKIPQDPDCATSPTKCYVYEPDPSSCPQWSVLYAALRGPVPPVNACPLVTRNASTACLPNGFIANKYNYCVLLGNISCSAIAGFTIGNGGGTGGGGGGGGGGAGPTPTPPSSCPNNQYYGCAGDNRCNSIFPTTQCVQFGGTINCVCDTHCNQSCLYN